MHSLFFSSIFTNSIDIVTVPVFIVIVVVVVIVAVAIVVVIVVVVAVVVVAVVVVAVVVVVEPASWTHALDSVLFSSPVDVPRYFFDVGLRSSSTNRPSHHFVNIGVL